MAYTAPLSQVSMRRHEIDCVGGASASPEVTCSRVNQRASSSSPLTVHGAAGGRAGEEAEHERGRERPRLRGVVAHVADRDAGFLEHFAHHGILEALARLDEAGDGRVAARRPARLPTEQRALAVAHQHDDRRVDAREELGGAGRVGAQQDVAGADRHGAGCRRRRNDAGVRATGSARARRRAAPPRSAPSTRRKRTQLLEAGAGWQLARLHPAAGR